MIKHVVLFKLKEFATKADKEKARDSIKAALLGLKDKIEVLKYIEVGIHYELGPSSFDLCLITHFDTIEDVETYRVHPSHQEVVAMAGKVVAERAAVDFEF